MLVEFGAEKRGAEVRRESVSESFSLSFALASSAGVRLGDAVVAARGVASAGWPSQP